jgi:hypothetical protein
MIRASGTHHQIPARNIDRILPQNRRGIRGRLRALFWRRKCSDSAAKRKERRKSANGNSIHREIPSARLSAKLSGNSFAAIRMPNCIAIGSYVFFASPDEIQPVKKRGTTWGDAS